MRLCKEVNVFPNIYAPNKVRHQCIYFKDLYEKLDGIVTSTEQNVIIVGDFNVTFDISLDCLGGSPAKKESVKIPEKICLDLDLIDTWRERNPKENCSLGRKPNLWFKEHYIFAWLATPVKTKSKKLKLDA